MPTFGLLRKRKKRMFAIKKSLQFPEHPPGNLRIINPLRQLRGKRLQDFIDSPKKRNEMFRKGIVTEFI